MKAFLLAIIPSFLLSVSSFAKPTPDGLAVTNKLSADQVRWLKLDGGQIEVNGLPWFKENKGSLSRLPLRSKDQFRPAVWSLAQSPSGGRLRFRSNTRLVAVRLEYPGPPNMANMHAYGQTGVDLYVDGEYFTTVVADKEAKSGKTFESVLFDLPGEASAEHEFTLYLPLYKSVKVLGIGIEAKANVASPKPVALPRPVVFYGTSITQGGAASRSGMSYEAIVCRKLNIDFVNLGFSGNGLGEPEVARAVSEIDAACFVLDFGANHKTGDAMRDVYVPFLATIRAKHPQTPIIVMSPIYTMRERKSVAFKTDWQERRDFIRGVVQKKIADGDTHLYFIEGTELLGSTRGDGLVDGSHPNDLGFYWMAEGLAPYLKKVLGLKE